ncbi:cyclin-dependent kinase inhibitor 4 [Capsicum chacoense]
MGKYIRKNKKGGEVSPLGVLTRAKALALKRAPSAAAAGVKEEDSGGSYLELRSGRLVKPFMVLEGRKQRNGVSKNANPKDCLAKEMEKMKGDGNGNSCCGENLLEFEGRKRTTRESTPCSLIRELDNIQIPGSSTRRIDANEGNSRQAIIPTAREMDEFFSSGEEQEVKNFIEKYNFDPVNEKPLPGRYEWVKVDC